MRGDAMNKQQRRGAMGGAMVLFTAAGMACGQNFSEEAVARGIVWEVTNATLQNGAGLGLIDLDNDGDPDLVAMGQGGAVGVWENDGTGHFTSRAAGSGMPTLVRPSGLSAADYDNDGDLDVHLTDFLGADHLMRNDGNFTFTDVAASAGVNSGGFGYGGVWGDYDGDGWVDLYVPNRTQTHASAILNHLYRNNGDGTFTDMAVALGVTDGEAPSLVAAFLDYDRDGDADLYLGNDKGSNSPWTNHLYRNEGNGTFTDVTTMSGTAANVDCMGIAWGDFDRNGWMDIYVTNLPYGNVLLMNQGDGTFVDETDVAGVGSYVVGWGTQFLDYDHDTVMDLFMVNTLGPNRMYRSGGTFPCVDMAPTLGVADDANQHSYVFAMGDVDLDGDLDLVTSPTGQNLRLYINNASNGNWAKFRVVGQGANGFGVGTVIDVHAAGVWQCRELQMGNNFKAQNDHLQHFGLAAATHMDEIVVAWPGGDTRTLTGYAANETWTLYPPERMGDVNNDGRIDAYDITRALDAMRSPFKPGEEIFDMDGDGHLTTADISLMGLDVSDRFQRGLRAGP